MGCAHSAALPDDTSKGKWTSGVEGVHFVNGRVGGSLLRGSLLPASRGSAARDGGSGPTPTLEVKYAARVRAAPGKDQDRYIIAAHGAQALSCGICDGHSVHDRVDGQRHAEAAAQHISTHLWRSVHAAGVTAAEASGEASAAMADAACATFVAHQRKCEERYNTDVADKLLEAKTKLEAEIGEELPLELPQEGGTSSHAS